MIFYMSQTTYGGYDMAVNIRVLKNGKPVSGVNVYYRKKGGMGGTGDRNTDSQGYASFQVDPGMAAVVRLRGNGISYETTDYFLQKGLNEFKF
jgi:hypothetical protein